MKKVISLLLVVLLSLLFAGCTQTTVNIAPVISGDATIYLDIFSEEPDWTTYITASDSADGVIRIMESMVDSSRVNMDVAGAFTVTYYVPDSEGMTVSFTLNVNIVDLRVPILNMIGEEEITIEVFSEYQELGIEAYDENLLPFQYIVDGDVIEEVIGVYPVVYNIIGKDYSLTRIVNVVDTTSPVISFDEMEYMYVILGGIYNEPGIVIDDNYDTGLEYTVDVVVNTAVEGEYLLTYTVTDLSGNISNEIVRSVTVIDAVFPLIMINGDIDITMQYGDDYIELGATVVDEAGMFDAIVSGDTIDGNTLGDFLVVYTYVDGDNVTHTVNRNVHVVDTTDPVIYLLGDPEIILEYGDEYFEAFALGVDNYDIGFDAIIDNSELDLSTLGTYNIYYNYTDTNGNVAEQVIRVVKVVDLEAPVITLNEGNNIYVTLGEVYTDPGVSITDNYDVGLDTNGVGVVDTSVEGVYTVTYIVTDSSGNVSIQVTRTITVWDGSISYPTGFYNFKFESTELRLTFMAAAEAYLMNNMYAGIPVFTNGHYKIYGYRIDLPINGYIPGLGSGEKTARMTEDDSNVIMFDGNYGNTGEYTFRTITTRHLTTFNQWEADVYFDEEMMSNYLDTLYVKEFNDNMNGFDIVPSMASDIPFSLNSYINSIGIEVSTTWQIPMRGNLEWSYHPATNLSGLPEGHENIDAFDFELTFKLAIDLGWKNAIEGDSSFLDEKHMIKNIENYIDGNVSWDEVGITAVDYGTFEFEFENEMSEIELRNWLTSDFLSPINIELYNLLESSGEIYGGSEELIAYNGPYYLWRHAEDSVIQFLENPMYHSPDEYTYTGIDYKVVESIEAGYEEFLAGNLDMSRIPSYTNVDHYLGNENLIEVSGPTSYRIMINGLGDVETQQEQFPGSTFEPKPILANQNFKQAMFFAIDREYLAKEVLYTFTSNMYLFTDLYFVDEETGITFRNTPEGESVGIGLSPETYGFDIERAIEYYKLAIAELIASGDCVSGTSLDPTVIQIDFYVNEGSEGQVLVGEYIELVFEAIFQDDVNHVNVDINVIGKTFPDIYYDYIMIGNFDLAIGGVSGYQEDAASFLDTYTSDNRSGFTLNWGIDTSIAEIEVMYTDSDGVAHLEIWSFDAIERALNGDVELLNGIEVLGVEAKISDITPTSFIFTVDLYDDPDHQDFTYTVQYYDYENSIYVDLDGKIGIQMTNNWMLVDGLDPYFDGVDGNGNDLYQGDYQVVINYKHSRDLSIIHEKVGNWFVLDELIYDLGVYQLDTSAIVELVVNENDYPRSIVGMTILVDQGDGNYVESNVATINNDNLSYIVIEELDPGTPYILVLMFDDGFEYYIDFVTEVSISIENALQNTADERIVVTGVVYAIAYYGFYIHSNGYYMFAFSGNQGFDNEVDIGDFVRLEGHVHIYIENTQIAEFSILKMGSDYPIIDPIESTVTAIQNDEIPIGTIAIVTGILSYEEDGEYFNYFITDSNGGRVQIYYRSNVNELDAFMGQVVTIEVIYYTYERVLFNGYAEDVIVE